MTQGVEASEVGNARETYQPLSTEPSKPGVAHRRPFNSEASSTRQLHNEEQQ